MHAPAHARAWVSAHTSALPAPAVDDALLIVSELVTNAVRYGAPDIVLGLDVLGDRIRIEVSDGGERLPVVAPGPPDVDRASGRGLFIVAATAADWGVARLAGSSGKLVWAEVPLSAGPTLR